MPADCEWPGGCANDPDHDVPEGVPVYWVTRINTDEVDGRYCRVHGRLRIREMGEALRATTRGRAGLED